MKVSRVRFDTGMEIASVVYLALPVLLFFIGWLRPLVASLMIGVLLAGVFWYSKQVSTEDYHANITSKRIAVMVAGGLMLAWVLTSGIGGLAPQTGDFNKHNAIVSDLTLYHWPVTYHIRADRRPLVYYTAYYLPPAAIGKLAPSHHVGVAHYALLFWSLLGILLVFYWLSRLAGKSTVLLVLLFIGFSGMDVIGSFITHTADNPVPLMSRTTDLEWYAGPANLQYSSNTTSLFWVPQHALAAWLVGSMLAATFLEKRSRGNVFFTGALTVLWSPLVAIGLLPLYVCLLGKRADWRELVSWQSGAAGLLVALFGLYFLAGSHQSLGTFLSFTALHYGLIEKIALLGLFILLEFGIYALLLAPYVRRRESKEWFKLFAVCTAFLVILPVFRLGIYNDLVMRASLPALLVIAVLAYRFVATRQTNPQLHYRQQLLIICLTLGLVSPLVEFNTHLLSKRTDVNYWYSIGNPAISPQKEPTINQYLGNEKSLFYKHLARN
jgi:hypothetical protein